MTNEIKAIETQNVRKIGHASREDWFQLARKCRAAKRLLSEIASDASRLCGVKIGNKIARVRITFIYVSSVVEDDIESKYGYDRELLDAFTDLGDDEDPTS